MIDRVVEAYPEKFVDRPPQSEILFELALAGDEDLRRLIRTMVADLAIGLANAVSLFSPEAIIISGGLCTQEELIIQPLRELVNQYGYYAGTRKQRLKIEQAQLGPAAPMIGAALLYRAVA